MGSEIIGVLPQDYPTFDWNDWKTSHDALVPGGLVSNFQKATWNAIVDALDSALTAAGYQWDNRYTTKDDAMVGSDGYLYASAFNSVRHNIDIPVRLGWIWAKSDSFRGFVGREDFNGHSTHKQSADPLYPEYIIELVRKLNLLISILNGSGPLVSHVCEYSAVSVSGSSLALADLFEIAIDEQLETKLDYWSALGFVDTIPFSMSRLSETDAEITKDDYGNPAFGTPGAVNHSIQFQLVYEVKPDPSITHPYSFPSTVSVESSDMSMQRFRIHEYESIDPETGEVISRPGFSSSNRTYIYSSTDVDKLATEYGELVEGKDYINSVNEYIYKFDLAKYLFPPNGKEYSGFSQATGCPVTMIPLNHTVQQNLSGNNWTVRLGDPFRVDMSEEISLRNNSSLGFVATQDLSAKDNMVLNDDCGKLEMLDIFSIELDADMVCDYVCVLGFVWTDPEWVNDDGWLFHQVFDYDHNEETGILEVI